MSKSRFIAIVVVVLVTASQLSAAGPFGRRRSSRPAQPPSRPAFSLPLSVLQSPEKMTELFGPSILVREEPEAAKKKSKYVAQP